MFSTSESLSVEIFGRTYVLRAEKNREYVQNLARMINDRMVFVEENTKTVDSVRVAVLAALNLADDYCSQREEYERRIKALEDEKNRLRELIQGALSEETPCLTRDGDGTVEPSIRKGNRTRGV